MDSKYKVGAITSFIAAVIGIVVALILFVESYAPLYEAEMNSGRPDEAFIVKYVIPGLSDITIVGGILWFVAFYGFLVSAKWAWSVAIAAVVTSLGGSFFPTIPAMSKGEPPLFAAVFGPNLVFYFILVAYIKKVPWKLWTVGLFTGMAFVLTFMNGVASIDRIILGFGSLYTGVQQLNWIASFALGTTTIAILLGQEWGRILGIGAALLGFAAGAPLAITNSIGAGTISLFTPAPVMSLLSLICLMWPGTAKLIARHHDQLKSEPDGASAAVTGRALNA